jgi:hypothetical protein
MNEHSPSRKIVAKVGRMPIEVLVLGKRDPRGPDNNILIWVDDTDRLHIRVWKTNRCYEFEKVIETRHRIEVIAK